ncbi:MAG: DUF1345 domain-containing protein [Bacteroidetes bacterium]|nr:DUF1345 domain-containing protein [Bacteroidota bacterium]
MSATSKKERNNFFLQLHPGYRVLISVGVALIAYFFINMMHIDSLLKVMYLWNVFSLSLLILYWVVVFTRSVDKIREFSRVEDGSLLYVFLIILVSAFSSMFTVLLLFISKDISSANQLLYILAAIPSMLFSWAIIHTAFAFHYAHMYYDDSDDDPKKHAEGLIFPGEKRPDYRDFAYFSFVIGMTFQVSDVQITSRRIRHAALIHGLISFALNTIVVALSINLVAGFKK